MSLKKNFLIFANDDIGPRSAANVIAKAMDLRHPHNNSTTVIVNPLSYRPSNKSQASDMINNALALAPFHNIEQIIEKVQPNAILSTHETFGGLTAPILQTIKDRLPLYTVVTDFSDVPASWFDKHSDKFFVASDSVRAKAIACGISPQNIIVSGIPVNPGFATPQVEKHELRLRLGLDPSLPTLLFVGNRPVSGVTAHLEELECLRMPFQVVVNAGGNQQLFHQTIQRKWNFPIIQIHNAMTDMKDYLLCADLLATKADGLTISEGLAAGLPIFIIDYLPRQDEANARFLVNHRAGAITTSPEALSKLVHALFGKNTEIREIVAANARRCGHPDSALIIADALWRADETEIPQKFPRIPVGMHTNRLGKSMKRSSGEV